MKNTIMPCSYWLSWGLGLADCLIFVLVDLQSSLQLSYWLKMYLSTSSQRTSLRLSW